MVDSGMNKRTLYTCQYCGKEFKPKASNRTKYCSRQCAFDDWGKRAAIKKEEKEKIKIQTWPKCKQCGKPAKKYNQVYCSDECRKKVARVKSYEYSKKNHPVKHFKCKICGNEFIPEYGNKKRLFCSMACKIKGLKIERQKHHKEGNRRRRAIKRGATIEYFKTNEIYERDGWICGICGKPVKRGTQCPHPLSPTLDHIVPLAAGGTHERKNVQCAHFICNSTKGSGCAPHGDQLRLMG
jgi:endogenous inhibitor of DNA gyrase (YacG/DUF329 family)